MKNTPVINVGLAPGELFIVVEPGASMVALPAARHLARYEVLGRGEDWMACRVQEAVVDNKQHRVVERIAVFSQRDQAQALVDHLSALLMATEPEAPVERRVFRPGRGLALLLRIIAALIAVAAASAAYIHLKP